MDAYKWILNNLNTALQIDLDTSKVAVLGWSAGGTSALYLVGLLPSFASQSTKVLIHTSEQAHDAHKAGLQNPTCLVPTYPKVQMNDEKARPLSALKKACSEEEWKAIERLKDGPVCTGYRHG